jgi:2-dehydro-3-deoxyphosphogluconate aldolase/(4S)-4-hydroxy-2-oxoglutarate aldolase
LIGEVVHANNLFSQEKTMPQFSRLDVLTTTINLGLVPIFYHGDVGIAKHIVAACAEGGAKVVEFTNRGDFAYHTFTDLSRHVASASPDVILGVGSIVDAPTAAMYIASGANFIVGPTFNPEVARLCNRRKIPYMPGCGSLTEISQAEELGVEIVKVFPGGAVGGPGFVKAVLGPCPWTRLMPTGGVDATEESIRAWFSAGVTCVGIGSALIRNDWVTEGNFAAITEKTRQVLDWIQVARAT